MEGARTVSDRFEGGFAVVLVRVGIVICFLPSSCPVHIFFLPVYGRARLQEASGLASNHEKSSFETFQREIQVYITFNQLICNVRKIFRGHFLKSMIPGNFFFQNENCICESGLKI